MTTDRSVVVYTQPGCNACRATKDFLSARGIAFTERNIRESVTALEEFLQHGWAATPVTLVDGTALVGYNEERLKAAFGS